MSRMEWNELLEGLYEKKRQLPDLSIMEKATSQLEHPQLAYPTIHIAGTNGKGSCAQYLTKALALSGYRVGLYTSPHLEDFEERIQINFEQISQKKAQCLIHKVLPVDQRLSFFEIATLIAFLYFQEEKVDIAVIETGLGGKFDATNVVRPLVSVITSIGYDHESYLGDTLEQIAAEKAGIIKPNVPVIAGPSCHFESIEQNADHLTFGEKNKTFQLENQELVKLVIRELKDFSVDQNKMEEAFHMQLLGRMEGYTYHDKPILFDVAHNQSALQRVLSQIPFETFDLLFALRFDKDIEKCLEQFGPRVSRLYLIQESRKEFVPFDLLVAKCQKFGFEIVVCKDLEDAFAKALRNQNPLLITGSFYLVGPARRFFFDQYQDGSILSASFLELEQIETRV